MRAVRMQHVAEKIGKKHARLRLPANLAAVEVEADAHLLSCARFLHADAFSRVVAAVSAFFASTAARFCR
jgi:hypothetical protein